MKRSRHHQGGSMLIEALVGIIIFSIGVLALVALQARAIAVQSDAQYRIEATNLADQILGQIVLNVDRTSAASLQTTLGAFSHRTTTTANCNYSGNDSAAAAVTAWATAIRTPPTALPGANATMQQIVVDTGTFNRVTINICWQSPSDLQPRRHTLISYVN